MLAITTSDLAYYGNVLIYQFLGAWLAGLMKAFVSGMPTAHF